MIQFTLRERVLCDEPRPEALGPMEVSMRHETAFARNGEPAPFVRLPSNHGPRPSRQFAVVFALLLIVALTMLF